MSEKRLKDLEDNIEQDLALLKECEDVLRYTRDPLEKGKYKRDIAQLKQSVAQHQEEYNQLKQQSTSFSSTRMQYVSNQLSQITIRLDNLDDLFAQVKPLTIPHLNYPSPIKSKTPKQETPVNPSPKTETLKGNYSQLRQYLEQKQWREADQETMKIILKVANRERELWLKTEDIEQFSCSDLRIIDNLWLKYSQDKFGLSVQQKIWQQLGGKRGEFEFRIFRQFNNQVGWKKNQDLLDYKHYIFSLNAPEGHFPSFRLSDSDQDSYKNFKSNFQCFLSRIAICLPE